MTQTKKTNDPNMGHDQGELNSAFSSKGRILTNIRIFKGRK